MQRVLITRCGGGWGGRAPWTLSAEGEQCSAEGCARCQQQWQPPSLSIAAVVVVVVVIVGAPRSSAVHGGLVKASGDLNVAFMPGAYPSCAQLRRVPRPSSWNISDNGRARPLDDFFRRHRRGLPSAFRYLPQPPLSRHLSAFRDSSAASSASGLFSPLRRMKSS